MKLCHIIKEFNPQQSQKKAAFFWKDWILEYHWIISSHTLPVDAELQMFSNSSYISTSMQFILTWDLSDNMPGCKSLSYSTEAALLRGRQRFPLSRSSLCCSQVDTYSITGAASTLKYKKTSLPLSSFVFHPDFKKLDTLRCWSSYSFADWILFAPDKA